MSLSFNFNGKVALITGSSSGIGAETAILFAKSGANVVITSRSADKLAIVAKQCSHVSPNNAKALVVVADVSNEDDCRRLIETTIKTFGKLDILVNNAGINQSCGVEKPEFIENFKMILKNNLNSAVILTHLSVEHLAKTKGNIINISSLASLLCSRHIAPYSLSKCAMNMFTKCMAVELGPKGIRVNCISPGMILTNILVGNGMDSSDADEIFKYFEERNPVGRLGVPGDIGNAILFLSTEQASFITGVNFMVDGGALAANVMPPEINI